jgi:hypothetical protein
MRALIIVIAVLLETCLTLDVMADSGESAQKAGLKHQADCCHHGCCHRPGKRRPLDMPEFFAMPAPPRGVLISSVPVIEPSVLLSQSRYTATTPVVRAIGTPRSLDRGDQKAAGGSAQFSDEDRIDALEAQLAKAVETLHRTLTILKAHGIE